MTNSGVAPFIVLIYKLSKVSLTKESADASCRRSFLPRHVSVPSRATFTHPANAFPAITIPGVRPRPDVA